MQKYSSRFKRAPGQYSLPVSASELTDSVKQDYDDLSGRTLGSFSSESRALAGRIQDGRAHGCKSCVLPVLTVTEGVGGTGVVAMLENGSGPLVMMRADMDGLPGGEEKSGLPNASKAMQEDPITGNTVPVMHACGHDVHITSLVGTARQMVGSQGRVERNTHADRATG